MSQDAHAWIDHASGTDLPDLPDNVDPKSDIAEMWADLHADPDPNVAPDALERRLFGDAKPDTVEP